MNLWAKNKDGFTIVELLIVVVVIAILAAITIVSYNGIQNRAEQSAVQATVSQGAKKAMSYAITNFDMYPAQLSDIGLQSDAKTTFQYTVNNTASNRSFCITATTSKYSYYASNTQASPMSGICKDHSIIVWNKFVPSTNPVAAGVLDDSVFRTTSPSIRLAPNVVGAAIGTSAIPVTTGEVIRVNLWVKSDPGWVGNAGNSKIRYGNGADGALLHACSYDGTKLVWTNITCQWTVTAAVSSLSVSVGNSDATKNLWIDDIVVSR